MLTDISYTFGVISALVLVSNIEILNAYIARWWEQNKNKTLNDILVEVLWNTSYAYTFVKHRCEKLYSEFPLVRSFVDAISLPKKSAKPIVEYPWASITHLSESADGKLSVIETHFDLNDFEWQNKSTSENLLKLNNICKELLLNNGNMVECLLLFAENADCILSRVINRKNMDMVMDVGIRNKMVDVKFLLIDYVHPHLEESYELVVNKLYFMEGNHILSGAFVGRLLSKKGYSGPFDKSYRVVIIDQEVKTVEWTYADFIEVVDNKKYRLRLYEEVPVKEPVQPAVSLNRSIEDDETKSWDKVDKE
jgi:hypothetical protein